MRLLVNMIPLLAPPGKQGGAAPDCGWMVVDVNAATNKGKNALALVARDDRGNIACMAAKFLSGMSADIVELTTIEWAAEIVENLGWPKVLWWSDAKCIVDQIFSEDEPCVWSYRHQLLNLKQKFSQCNWKPMFWLIGLLSFFFLVNC